MQERVHLKVLITGGSGLLALNWACAIRDRHEVVLTTHRRHVNLAGARALAVPLEDTKKLQHALLDISPDIVVHTAGITSVDDCERNPDLAFEVNAGLARNVASAAAAVRARLIHISTDHLFAGVHPFYREDEPPSPLNAYARSKLEAEESVRREHPQALIVRTNFFGWGHAYRQSFSDWIYGALKAGETLTMFDDVFITPILIDELVRFAHRLLELDAYGVYNIAGSERISKYDFALSFADAYGFPRSLLTRAKILDAQLFARRPSDMSLDNRKASDRLGTPLGNIAEYLRLLQQQNRVGRREELLAAITG